MHTNKSRFLSFIIFLFLGLLSTHLLAKPQVVTSIKPVFAIVSSIAGDTLEVEMLVQDPYSPHSYRLKPSDMSKILKAEAIFYVHSSIENFLPKALENASARTKIVQLSQARGLSLFEYRTSENWKLGGDHHHDHDEDEHHEDEHHEDEHHEDEHHEDEHHEDEHHEDEHHEDEHHESQGLSSYDMHIWLDPQNLKVMSREVAKQLSKLYPQNAGLYAQNAEAFQAAISKKSSELEEKLQAIRNKNFIVYHDAYQYFEKRFRLSGVGALSLHPGESLSPQRLNQVKKLIRDESVVCIFKEPQFSGKSAEAALIGTNASLGEIDPLGVGIEANARFNLKQLDALADGFLDCLAS